MSFVRTRAIRALWRWGDRASGTIGSYGRMSGGPRNGVILGTMARRMHDVRRFIDQMSDFRRAAVVGLATILVLALALNFVGHWWERHAFVANVVADAILLGLAALLVDEYISYLAAQRWAPVAAFALEDLGRVSRAVFVRNTQFIQPNVVAMRQQQLKQQVRSADGRAQQEQALATTVSSAQGRKDLYDLFQENAKATRDVVMRWAPVLVQRGPLAGHLSEFTRLHRMMVQVLGFLHHEQANQPLPVSEEEIVAKVLAIDDLAMDVDDAAFHAADQLAPLFPAGP